MNQIETQTEDDIPVLTVTTLQFLTLPFAMEDSVDV